LVVVLPAVLLGIYVEFYKPKNTPTASRDADCQRKGAYYNNDGTYTNNYFASDEAEDDFFYELDYGDDQDDL
jgi:hypothetical protein